MTKKLTILIFPEMEENQTEDGNITLGFFLSPVIESEFNTQLKKFSIKFGKSEKKIEISFNRNNEYIHIVRELRGKRNHINSSKIGIVSDVSINDFNRFVEKYKLA